MRSRPSRTLIAAEVGALLAVPIAALALNPFADWDPVLFAVLLVIAIAGDLTRIDLPGHRIGISGSFLAIVSAAVFLGGPPAALIGVLTILSSWLKDRYLGEHLLINVLTYAWFPLLAGIVFHGVIEGAGVATGEVWFYLLVFGVFCLALAIDFALIAGYSCYVERSSFIVKIRRALLPLLPSELASALLAVGVAWAYLEVGTGGVALLGVLVLVFQYLVGALLLSQERADELELRAKQLAGFQVALLSALLRTLDLRDRMTARHSAAVARYAREIAAEAGLSVEDQALAHSAGLLHDIGKFSLPDSILKSARRQLNEREWSEIKKHPAEGARIVAQIDGYAPIAELILAHHEQIDGTGYPSGLVADEIPELARVIAVADAYDVMTARDSYRAPMTSHEAMAELRRVSGRQFDGRFVEALIRVLQGKDLAYRHGADVDFEAELALDSRINDYVSAGHSLGALAGRVGP